MLVFLLNSANVTFNLTEQDVLAIDELLQKSEEQCNSGIEFTLQLPTIPQPLTVLNGTVLVGESRNQLAIRAAIAATKGRLYAKSS